MNSREFNKRIVSLSPRIFPLTARMLNNQEEAADAVQEIMLKLWKNRSKLKHHPNLNGFVFLTARNHCLDSLKARKKENKTYLDSSLYLESKEGPERYEEVEMDRIIRQIIDKLPQKQREIVLLRDIDGLEFNEIVSLTEIKIENIRVLLSRARKKISQKLTETYNYEYKI